LAIAVEFEKLLMRKRPGAAISGIDRQCFGLMIKRNDEVDLVGDKVDAFEMFVIGQPDDGTERGILRRCR